MISMIHEQGGLVQINHPGRQFSNLEQAALLMRLKFGMTCDAAFI